MLISEINKIKFLLSKIISDLELAQTDDFTSNFANAKERMILVKSMKTKLLENFPLEELMTFDKELTTLTKLIQEKYDNIVEYKKKQLKEVSERIRFIQNRKKLISYNR